MAQLTSYTSCFLYIYSPEKALESKRVKVWRVFKMYYVIGASVSSLHRESTDSLIALRVMHFSALILTR